MAIRGEGVSVVRVGELIVDNPRIPPYQRPYSWEPSTALQLLNDISDAFQDKERSEIPYVLGAVILHQEEGRDSALNVVDGQQRLLTFKMILAILDGADGGKGAHLEPLKPILLASTSSQEDYGNVGSPPEATEDVKSVEIRNARPRG